MPKSLTAEDVASSTSEPSRSASDTQNDSALVLNSDASMASSRPNENTIGSNSLGNDDAAVEKKPGSHEELSNPACVDDEASSTGIIRSSSSERKTLPKIFISDAESETAGTSSCKADKNGEDRRTGLDSSVTANPAHVKQEPRENRTDSYKEQSSSSSRPTRSEETSSTIKVTAEITELPNGESEEQIAHECAAKTPHTKAEKDYKAGLDIFNGFYKSCDAQERFHDNDTQCLANNEKGLRCQARIRGSDKAQIQKCLDILQSLCETERYIAELRKLARLAVCGRSHRRKALDRIAALIVLNGEIIDVHGSCPEKAATRRAREPKPARRVGATATVHFEWTTRTRRSPAVQARITVFVPYVPESLKRLSTIEVVRRQMQRPLSAREEASGFLYVYWDESNFGYCKIGVTTGAVSQRLAKWQSQCRKPATQLYECESVRTPHAHRLEALVHAELKKYRRKELRCLTCNKTHREWFCVPDSHTIPRTVAIWRDWMLKEPYELIDGQWELKAAHAGDVDMMCKRLLERPQAISPRRSTARSPPRPRGPRQLSGGRGRYNLRSSTKQRALMPESPPPAS